MCDNIDAAIGGCRAVCFIITMCVKGYLKIVPSLIFFCFNVELLNIQQHVNPKSKVHGANMGPIWGRQDPGGLHVGPINFSIWE